MEKSKEALANGFALIGGAVRYMLDGVNGWRC